MKNNKYLFLSRINNNINDSKVFSKKTSISFNETGGDYTKQISPDIIARFGSTSFTLDGFIFNCGGYTTTTTSVVSIYNDMTNNWAAGQSSTERYYTSGNELSGFGYIVGGYSSISTTYSNESYQFNRYTNSWISKAPAPNPKRECNGFTNYNFLYTVGGYHGSVYLSTSEQYSDSIDTWTSTGTTPATVSNHAGFSTKDYGYICAGRNASLSSATLQYNTQSNSWSTKATLDSGIRTGVRSCSTLNSGYLCFGNNGGATYYSGISRYSEDINVWWYKARNLDAKAHGTSSSLNGYCYFIDGYNGSSLSTCSQYRNHNLYDFVDSFYKSDKPPKSIKLSTNTVDDVYSTPCLISTNGGTTWRYMESNKDSFLKGGETYTTAVSSTSANYFDYRIKIGIPTTSYTAGLGGDYVSSKGNTTLAGSYYNSCFNLDGFVYISQGATDGSGTVYISGCVQYNSTLNSYQSKQNAPTAKFTAYSYTLNGLGYSWGGQDSGGLKNTMETYSDISNTWNTKTPSVGTMVATKGNSGFILHGLSYIAGKLDASSNGISTVNAYSDALDALYSKQNITTARGTATCTSFNGYGYICCGRNTSTSYSTVEKYSDTTNTWTAMSNMLVAKYGPTSSAIRTNMIIIGGTGSSSDIHQYLDTINLWIKRSSNLTQYRNGISIDELSEFGYFFHGYSTSSTNICEQYVVSSSKTPVLSVSLEVVE